MQRPCDGCGLALLLRRTRAHASILDAVHVPQIPMERTFTTLVALPAKLKNTPAASGIAKNPDAAVYVATVGSLRLVGTTASATLNSGRPVVSLAYDI